LPGWLGYPSQLSSLKSPHDGSPPYREVIV
jgi:hypothetical protein